MAGFRRRRRYRGCPHEEMVAARVGKPPYLGLHSLSQGVRNWCQLDARVLLGHTSHRNQGPEAGSQQFSAPIPYSLSLLET